MVECTESIKVQFSGTKDYHLLDLILTFQGRVEDHAERYQGIYLYIE